MGGGKRGERGARAASPTPGAKIAAIYGTTAKKGDRLCRESGGKPFADLDAFLSHRPMQAVILGSPSGRHAEQGLAAPHRDLHVLTEKPIDIATKRADDLIDATNRAGVKLAVIFQDRLKPNIRALKQWLDSGSLGKPLLIDARVKWYRPPDYFRTSKWRGTFALDGGGALLNPAIHTVHLLLWLFR